MSDLQKEETQSLTIIELGSDRTLGQVTLAKGTRILVASTYIIRGRKYAECVFQSSEGIHHVAIAVSPRDRFEEVKYEPQTVS